MINLFKVAMSKSVTSPLIDVIHSGWIGQGPKVETFEGALKRKFNNKLCLSLSSGTHGLSLALQLIDVGPGDEVITTPLTCTATNMPILYSGANIVWADVKDDFNIDPKSVKELINPGVTKAIVAVHWGGYPCDMEEIYRVAKENDIWVIEDGAHAYGSFYKNTIIGDCTFSDFCMFSFQAIKHLTCVDGGALFMKNKDFYRRGKLLRWYGIDREGPRTDFRCEADIPEAGNKWHMNDVCAMIGLENMPLADENIKIGRKNAQFYDDTLYGAQGVTLTQTAKDRLSSYWLYTIMVEKRSDFCSMMANKGIAVSRVHERNDKHTCFQNYQNELPNLEKVMERYICIPVGWWVTKEEIEYIVETIKGGW